MKYFPFQGYSAMSWCGKVITRKDKVSDKVLNHERIHLDQALELAKVEKTSTWLTYYWQYLKYWLRPVLLIILSRLKWKHMIMNIK